MSHHMDPLIQLSYETPKAVLEADSTRVFIQSCAISHPPSIFLSADLLTAQ